MEQASDKKIWTWQSALQDHVTLAIESPFIVFNPFVLSPIERECINEGVYAIHKSAFSKNLQSRLVKCTQTEQTLAEDKFLHDDFMQYGETYARNDGKGEEVDGAYLQLFSQNHFFLARCSQSFATFAYWESLVSNTVGSFILGTCRGAAKPGSNVLFELLFFFYYAPMLLIFWIMSLILTPLSFLPTFILDFFALALALVALVFALPISLLGLVFACISPETQKPLAAGSSDPDYAPVPDVVETSTASRMFEVEVDKGDSNARLGISLSQDDDASIAVSMISADGLLASQSALQRGDRILSINGTSTQGLRPKSAAKLLRQAQGKVTIVAEKGDMV